MFLIWSGTVIVYKGAFPSPIIIGFRGPGEAIGEMALLDNQTRSATIVALDPVRLLRVDRSSFHEWLKQSPQLGLGIMELLTGRLRTSDNIRTEDERTGRRLIKQVSKLQSEKEQLLELQRVRQETSDLVVHDLRNPLGIIYGSLSMLEVVLPEDALEANRELLGLAVAACERMQRLVDSLLDVSRLETGELGLSLAPTNLRPLLEEAINRVSISWRSRNVTMNTVIPEDLPVITIDADKIDRVLANLIDNALKFTPGNGTITISVEWRADHLILSVTDTGPGIPREEQQRIFERFAQVSENQPAGGRRGFGLGLTFCKLTVEAHGGQIWVEDGPDGIGSRFAFTLPL